ncbi:hypothetical protein [Streptomyces griseoluteus]|uniref:hypothetical protein n=1 Tax=Streptomyces griseoluteus TaxID=29306 RepID=UPI00365D3145
MERTDPPPAQPSPGAHNPRDCRLCGINRHPAQAAQGRQLTKHLAANPFPRQRAGVR